MVKKISVIFNFLDAGIKYSIYALVFLLPVLHLPWFFSNPDFLKQALLILLSFVATFFWLLKLLIAKKASFSQSKIHLAVLFLLLAFVLSAIFSLYKYGSFWELISIVSIALVYFLASCEFSKKEIIKIFYIFLVSAFIVQMGAIFGFNAVGSAVDAGFFSAALAPLLIILVIKSEKWAKIFFGLQLTASTAILFLINYSLAWWLASFGAFLVFLLGIFRRDLFDLRWLALPLAFVFLPLAVFLPQKIIEQALSQKASFEIALNSLKKSPIFGTGPGTFSSIYRPGSKFLADLATTGILGIIAFFALLDCAIFSGLGFLAKKNSKSGDWFLICGLFLFFLSQSLMVFLRSWPLTFVFAYFLTIAFILGLGIKKKGEFKLNSRAKKIIFAAIFLIAIIFSGTILFLEGRRVLAEIYFKKLNFQAAANLNPSSDIYFRQLALEKIQKLQAPDAVNASKRATDLNPNSALNWLTRGYVYQNLTGLVDSAQDWAIISYSKALELDPQNSGIKKALEALK